MSEFKQAIYPSLEGTSVFITGGASGIGAELVRAFCAQKSKVGFVDFDKTGSQNLVDELVRSGTSAEDLQFEHCDLKDIDALNRAFSNLADKIGAAGVLVNNAARDDRHTWQEIEPEYFDERIATNVRHQLFAIKAVAPGMIAAGKGSIINMGSNSWLEAQGGFPAYTMSKAAVYGLTRGMARDLGPHRIRVNTVVPGWVMTERQKELWVNPEAISAHKKKQCLPDLIAPEYIARMTLFLASDDGAMCTAQHYLVDAGSS
ncbi:MAG: SDR family NAD(P)-dependent oxidoreductase [Alphaproteobacteria bacterium]